MESIICATPKIKPRLKNRFYVKYPKPFEIHKMATHKVSPVIYKGENKWGEIVFELYDGELEDFAPVEWVKNKKTGIKYQSVNRAVLEGLDRLKQRKSQKIAINIIRIDEKNKFLENWEVIGFIKKVDFGGLDYNDDGVSKIKIFFKVVDAVLKLEVGEMVEME